MPEQIDYRLRHWDEIFEMKRNDPNLFDYIDFVYGKLNSLSPGESYSVAERIRPENRQRFVKIACMYMSESNEYVFGKDYFTIRRLEESTQQTIERINETRYGRERRSQEMDSKTSCNTANDSGWIESGGNRR